MRIASTLLCAAAVFLCSCEEKAEPVDPTGDRTLEALRREVDRANRGEAIGRAPDAVDDPTAKLADIATQDAAPKTLPLPEKNATAHLGTVAVKVAGLSTMHSVKAGRLELTSEDAFLEVKLATQNVGKRPVQLDLTAAQVRDGSGQPHAIASDVQRGAGTRELSRTVAPEERVDVTLYFEVPPAVVGNGLVLVLPAAASPSATEDVVLPLD